MVVMGREWGVNHIELQRKIGPADASYRSRWSGEGLGLEFRLCRTIKQVLATESESNRWSRRAVEQINAIREEKTIRDERGIGSVRDAFADMLSPGTSTIQTRARYFLFVPWMYLSIENKRVQSSKIANRARAEKSALIREIE